MPLYNRPCIVGACASPYKTDCTRKGSRKCQNYKNMEDDNMEEKKIDKLYELLDRAERERDNEAAAALRWAIFQLESR